MKRIVVSNDMLFTCKSSLGDTLSLHKLNIIHKEVFRWKEKIVKSMEGII